MSSSNTDPAEITLSSTCPRMGGTHGIRIQVHNDRYHSTIRHRESALTNRRRYPTHRRRVALGQAPHASQRTCTFSGAGSGVEQKGVQAPNTGGMWLRCTRRCTMNVNGRVSGKWKCPGYICMSSINTLNRMPSALSRNGRLDGAGMAWGPERVGFGSAQKPRRTVEARRGSGGRLSTRHGILSLLITILTMCSVFWTTYSG